MHPSWDAVLMHILDTTQLHISMFMSIHMIPADKFMYVCMYVYIYIHMMYIMYILYILYIMYTMYIIYIICILL